MNQTRLGSQGQSRGPLSMAHWLLVPLAVGITAHPAPLTASTAQDTLVVSSEPACGSCSLEFEHVVRLGGFDDPVLLEYGPIHVRVTRNGSYIARTTGMSQLIVYNPDGAFQGTIGRDGDGPGEFRYITRHELDDDDSLFVFDASHGRLSVFDPTGSLVRTERLDVSSNELIRGAVRMGPEEWVLSHHIHSPERAGLPLQYMRYGAIERSFGSTRPTVDPLRPSLNIRHIQPADEGSVWAVRPDRYELERWSVDGTLRRVFRRHADWFPVLDEEVFDPQQIRPDPRVRDLRRREDHFLAVMVTVADRDWRADGPPWGLETAAQIFDTVVEIIDPASGQLVARGEHDHRLEGFLTDELVYHLTAGELGVVYVDVLRMELIGSDPDTGRVSERSR